MTNFVRDDVVKVKYGISKDNRGIVKSIIKERDDITCFESTYEVLLENGNSD